MTSKLLALPLVCALAGAAPQVSISAPTDLPAPARYGLDQLQQALRGKGLAFAQHSADYRITARIAPPLGPEGLSIQLAANSLTLSGGDANGLMYAALEAADRISSAAASTPFALLRNSAEKPFLRERAVSLYTMQRAWFESRLYDQRHWERYFDLLARSRLNTFVVIFGYENGGFLAPAYPYFFDVPGFPAVRMVGLSKEQQQRNAQAFHNLIRIAHQRGIRVTAAPWDHIYRGGVQGGGIPGASELAGKDTPGLVTGVTTANVAAYNKAAIRRFVEAFPEIDALQFRMHGESGLKREEMAGFWHEAFTSLKAIRPDLPVDLRAKELPDEIIADALSTGLRTRITTKYWMEQMGLPFHPTHVNPQNMHDRRHGYADLLRYPQSYTVVWRLWSGGTTRLLLWGDPDYVRRFAQSARLYSGDSFEVNEMLATRMLGAAHDAPPRPIHNPKYRHYDYEFERYWHFYQLWGRLTYNPDTPPDTWTRDFQRRFGPAGPAVMAGLHEASRVLPRIVAAAYPYSAFPTTRGWVEMQRFGDLPRYAATVEGSDTGQFMSLPQRARAILLGTPSSRRTPEQTAAWFASTSQRILAQVETARKSAPQPPSNELLTTLADLEILARLAAFHSHRLPAGLAYALYQQTGSSGDLAAAVAAERAAVKAWQALVAAAGDIYAEDLQFGAHAVGFPHHWKEELARLQEGLARLEAEQPRQQGPSHLAPPAVALQPPPQVHLDPPAAARPGQDLRITARVSNPAALRTLVLRYRHLTQFEDYLSAPMARDPQSGRYAAVIPGAFIQPRWDLVYFVEAIGASGSGRNYPDLEVEAPYVVVPVVR